MADIKLACPNCGAMFQVSEYIDSTIATCPECANEVEIKKAVVEDETGLKVRKDQSGSGFAGSVQDSKPVVAKAPELTKKDKKRMAKLRKQDEENSKKKVKVNPYEKTAPRIWHGVATFIILGGLFYVLQAGLLNNVDGEWYYKIRLFLFPIIYLAVIITAFGEGYLPGILCLLLPPYLFYYAVSRTDVYYIRGAFLAMLLGIGLELFYDPERAVVTHIEAGINTVIDGGAGAINRAGSSGVEFVD